MSAIEAFSRGTPVVTSNIGAITELVEHKRTSMLFHPGDPTDLATQVEWLLTHPQQLHQMRHEARAEFEAKYTAEDNYKRLIEIYQSVLVNHSGSRAK